MLQQVNRLYVFKGVPASRHFVVGVLLLSRRGVHLQQCRACDQSPLVKSMYPKP
jgi:hypothetical protein